MMAEQTLGLIVDDSAAGDSSSPPYRRAKLCAGRERSLGSALAEEGCGL